MTFRSLQRKFFLLLACTLSLGLIAAVDSIAINIFNSHFPFFFSIAQIRLFSLVICFSLYYFSTFKAPPSPEVPNWKKSLLIASFWISSAIYFVLIKKIPVLQIQGWEDIVSFMATGLLAEELLFRGYIYSLIKKNYPNLCFLNIPCSVVISSLLFGLHHLSYHHFQFSFESMAQVCGTLIMGLFLGSIRESSGQVWPAVLLHFLNNSLTIIRNFHS